MPEDDPPRYPVVGKKFSEQAPKDHGPQNQPWGKKTFTPENVPDYRVRDALVRLQDITSAIQDAMEKEKMPPDELARRADISLNNMLAVLRGAHAPSWEVLSALLSVLDIRLDVDPKLAFRPTIAPEPGRDPHWWPGKRRRRATKPASDPPQP